MSRVLLVRHGQASFGAEDYDNLSPLGQEQTRLLGAHLARRGVVITHLVSGAMRRHLQSAEQILSGGGWDVEIHSDEGWNEFDHRQVLLSHGAPSDEGSVADRTTFQRWFEDATAAWIRGDADAAGHETFAEFTRRVEGAFTHLLGSLPADATALVSTSGGPVAWIAAHLLGGGADLWQRLNPTTVNSSHATVVVGSRGTTLVSLNEHGHLDVGRISYR